MAAKLAALNITVDEPSSAPRGARRRRTAGARPRDAGALAHLVAAGADGRRALGGRAARGRARRRAWARSTACRWSCPRTAPGSRSGPRSAPGPPPASCRSTRMAASLSRRISGTARMPCGLPPSRASAWVVPGECADVAAQRLARVVDVAEHGVGGERDVDLLDRPRRARCPRAYQPIALGPLTMNIAARSTYCETSFTRYVRTSERLAPFSTAAIDVLQPVEPGRRRAGCGAAGSPPPRPSRAAISFSLIFSS